MFYIHSSSRNWRCECLSRRQNTKSNNTRTGAHVSHVAIHSSIPVDSIIVVLAVWLDWQMAKHQETQPNSTKRPPAFHFLGQLLGPGTALKHTGKNSPHTNGTAAHPNNPRTHHIVGKLGQVKLKQSWDLMIMKFDGGLKVYSNMIC